MNLRKPALLCMVGFIYITTFGQEAVTIHYTNSRATSVSIESTCVPEKISVRLKNSSTKILGKISSNNGRTVFTPSFPFSSDLIYEVICDNYLITAFTPQKAETDYPYIVSVFPLQDTLPENLLKMHIVFSQPMVTGKSYKHIRITENGNEIKPFLELESELWNEDQTVFTIWLDPGRIKRDLTPNLLYGNPLSIGRQYTVTIDSLWKDQNSQPLQHTFVKSFTVGDRDELLPNPTRWTFASHSDVIKISFHEPPDYLLIKHAFTLWQNEKPVPMQTKIIANTAVELLPAKKLIRGVYTVKIDPKLEDLAGNNLVRPFDKDLNTTAITEKPISEIQIYIHQ